MNYNAEFNPPMPPAVKRKTNKGLLKYILLSFITFGIYPVVVMSGTYLAFTISD